ncbi:MAG: adenylate kinase [Chloroflexota bacterium]|nr:MAG: adenylate kinase [Chloroflexota bacterium]
MRCVILLGPPGAGKGTQAEMLSEEECLEHISSGAIFRENLKNQTELGKLAATYINNGELVPDDVTIAMVRDRLSAITSESGFLLDGFPRTRTQAEALKDVLQEFDENLRVVAIYIKVPSQELISRLTGRLTCRAEGHIFHTKYNPPKIEGRCDHDGSELYQRDDDKPETVKKRIQVYLEQTIPVIDYYQNQALLVEVDGNQSVEEVSAAIRSALKV